MFFSALQVPNAQRVVLGRRDRTASVQRDDDPVHRIAVAFERADALAALQVPNPAKGSYAPASPDRVPTWRRGNE